MSRPLILSNGRLMVGLDEDGLVHDFYYPYIGQDNLTTARSVHHKIGVWIDDVFSWVDDGTWETYCSLEDNALIGNASMTSSEFQIRLDFVDFVDSSFDAFIRRVTVTNLSNQTREIRIFFHQVFQIADGGRGDTAFFVPDPKYVYTYRDKIGLLSYCRTGQGQVFDQFAVGMYGVDGKEGTFKDAEDGELSGNAVEHGGVDSVLRVSLQIAGRSTAVVDYWTVAADSHDSQYECEQIHERLLSQGSSDRESATRNSWGKWLSVSADALNELPVQYQQLTRKSLMLIKAHTDTRGAILASGDSSIFNYGRDYYSYCWPRDAAFALWPLIRLGYTAEAKKFFIFCRDVVSKKGYLQHKFMPDRSVGSTWHPLLKDGHKELAIQEDETAIVIIMMSEYLKATDDANFIASLYADVVKPMADFLAQYIDDRTNLPHASYDLWEEKFLTNTYTVAVTEQALYRAAEIAKQFKHNSDHAKWTTTADRIRESTNILANPDGGYYRKGLLVKDDESLMFDETLDVSSLYGMLMFSTAEDRKQHLAATAAKIEQDLFSQNSGGTARYQNDAYMREDPSSPGNPWFVCTLWMAQYYAQTDRPDKTKEILDWAINLSLASGVLSEQVDPKTGAQISVAPLVWSHAEFINTVLDLAD